MSDGLDLETLEQLAPEVMRFWKEQKAKNIKPGDLDKVVLCTWDDMSSSNSTGGLGCLKKSCTRRHMCLYCREENHGIYGPDGICPLLETYQTQMRELIQEGFASSEIKAELSIQKLLYIQPWTPTWKRLHQPRQAGSSKPRRRILGDFFPLSQYSCGGAAKERNFGTHLGASSTAIIAKDEGDDTDDGFLVLKNCRLQAELEQLLEGASQRPTSISEADRSDLLQHAGEGGKQVLIVAEKPRIAKTLAIALSKIKDCQCEKVSSSDSLLPVWKVPAFEYGDEDCCAWITSTRGHICGLGFEVDDWYTPLELLEALSERTVEDRKVILHLQKWATSMDAVILCLDDDFEGERIAFDVRRVVAPLLSTRLPMDLRVKRCLFSSLTWRSLTRAIESLVMPDLWKAKAVSVRQDLDLRAGIPPTRFLTNLLNQRVSDLPPHEHARMCVRQLGCTSVTLNDYSYERSHFEDVPKSFWEHARSTPFTSVRANAILQLPFAQGSVFEDDIHELLMLARCALVDAGCIEQSWSWTHETKPGSCNLKVSVFTSSRTHVWIENVDASVISDVLINLKDEISPYGLSLEYSYDHPRFNAKVHCECPVSSFDKHLECLTTRTLTAFKITVSYGPCQTPALLFLVQNANAIDTFKPVKEFFLRMNVQVGEFICQFQSAAALPSKRVAELTLKDLRIAQRRQNEAPSKGTRSWKRNSGQRSTTMQYHWVRTTTTLTPRRTTTTWSPDTHMEPTANADSSDGEADGDLESSTPVKENKTQDSREEAKTIMQQDQQFDISKGRMNSDQKYILRACHVEKKRAQSSTKCRQRRQQGDFQLRELRVLETTLQPKPLTTTTLCQLAATQLGMSSHETLFHAQHLYERGQISYIRTETDIYPEDFDPLTVVLGLIGTKGIHKEVLSYAIKLRELGLTDPRNDGKCDGHEPIYPLCRLSDCQLRDSKYSRPGIKEDDSEIGRLTLLELIQRHFLATVSPPLLTEKSTFYVCKQNDTTGTQPCSHGTQIEFQAMGFRCVDSGWAKILPIVDLVEISPFAHVDDWRCPLYAHEQIVHGEPVRVCDVELVEENTKCPSRITEVKLLAAMERDGIGTDATKPQHILNLEKRGYMDVLIRRNDNHESRWNGFRRELRVTRFGKALIHSLALFDKKLVSPSVRAEVEMDYTRVAEGSAQPSDVVARRLKQYKERFEGVFQSLGRDNLLVELLAGEHGKDRRCVTKKQQEARAIVADISLKKPTRGPSNTAEQMILGSDLCPTLSDLPSEGAVNKRVAIGDCIASDSLAWRIEVDDQHHGQCQRVALQDIRAGDLLLSLDSKTGETIQARVQRLELIPPRDSVKVELIDGSVMICTGDHPVLCSASSTVASGSLYVIQNRMYSKPASELQRGQDSVCILASGEWVALPLLHEPQALKDDDIDMPEALVNFSMVDDWFKPFLILSETMGRNSHGIAVGSSPESFEESDSNWSSETASSDGRSFVLVGAVTMPDQVSLGGTRALPRNGHGFLTSFGSSAHDDEIRESCYVCWPNRNRAGGCRYGVLCDRCHMDHPELPERVRARRRRGGGGPA